MACVHNETTGRRVTLGARCLIGRARHCALRLEGELVSGEHAILRYKRGRWMLRDLGSSNGTELDGVGLEPGREIEVSEGAVMSFGSREHRFRLLEAGPPRVGARSEDGARRVLAESGILALPDGEAPECQVYADDDGRWILESADEVREVSDEERVELGEGAWVLELPPQDEKLATTRTRGARPRLLRLATLHFYVSRDGDYIELSVVDGSWRVDLGARSFNEMLLVLAQSRLHDRRELPHVSAAEHGWNYTDELCRKINATVETLNLHVFRVRRQLAQAGLDNAAQIVERRPSTRQLRLGTDRVVIESL